METLTALRQRLLSILLTTAALLFFITGLPWLSRPGIQNDEALFASVIYYPVALAGSVRVHHHTIPTMVMTYVGCLKGWLYMAIFKAFPPTIASIRLPVLLVCTSCIVISGFLTNLVAGPRAAVIAAFLLASDSMFLLTGTLDWGPVAFQHFFILSGALALLIGIQRDRPWLVALAGLCFGLGLWDKALFLWILSGLIAGLMIVYPRQSLRAVTLRNAASALIGLLIGAAPLIGYNAKYRLATIHGNEGFGFNDLNQKVAALNFTFTESALFGWLGREDPSPAPQFSPGALDRLSLSLDTKLGHPQRNRLSLWLAALLPLTLIRSTLAYRRLFACALVIMGIAWLQMAATIGAGGSAHHIILLWPVPQFLLAIGLARIIDTPGWMKLALVAAILAALVVTNLAITNSYNAALVRNGPTINWTDANLRLVEYLENNRQVQPIFVDWGMYNTVRLLGAGRLAIDQINVDPGGTELDANTSSELTRVLSMPGAALIGHTSESRFFPDVDIRITKYAAEHKLERKEIAVIQDGFGRPAISIFRLLPIVAGSDTISAIK